MNSPATACPEPGVLRAWLDQQAPDSLADPTSHIATCAECADTVGELKFNATLAATTIGRLPRAAAPAPAEIDAALCRLHSARTPRLAELAPAPVPLAPKRRGWLGTHWRVASGIAAALLLSVFVVSPRGRAATAQMLGSFRGEKFVVVPVSATQLMDIGRSLEPLDHFGTVSNDPALGQSSRPATIAEAGRLAGFQVKTPDPSTLPAGVKPDPGISVMTGGTVRFTFDQAKARAYYASSGRQDVRLPDRFDGASLVVKVPNAVVLDYTGPLNVPFLGQQSGTEAPVLVVGQAGQLEASVEGNVTLEEMREFLLSLPGLPQETVRSLRAIQDWRTTLPIPLPVEVLRWQETKIAGTDGLMLTDKIVGIGNAAIWQRDGRIYAVGALGGEQGVRRIAEGLR